MVSREQLAPVERVHNEEGGVGSEALQAYLAKTKKCASIYEKARKYLAGGGSHNARFFEPYPFFARKAKGKYIWDADGNRYVDYWMGHTALILGHSPPVATFAINRQSRNGLLLGTPNLLAVELASLISDMVPCAESIRFCTTGAEATMYAIRLARSFTKKKLIGKIAGGWHGYSSTLAIGVSPPYDVPESAGLTPDDEKNTRLMIFNDIENARTLINNDDLAAIILEPVLGAGGVIPADIEFLRALREECDRKGIVLIFDEIITGFRLAAGGAQEHYGILPDLCTLGKIMGGGLPASAIAGKKEIMELADTTIHKEKTERAWIGGGTFSENALPMAAGIATLKYLSKNRRRIYRRLGTFGDRMRKEIDSVFGERGIRSKTTGLGSLFVTHFLPAGLDQIRSPQDANLCLKGLEHDYYFSLIAKKGIFFLPGHIGAISTAHTDYDLSNFLRSTEAIANQIREDRSYSIR